MVQENGISGRSFVMGDQTGSFENSASLNTSPLQFESTRALSGPAGTDGGALLNSQVLLRPASAENVSLQSLAIDDRSAMAKEARLPLSEVKPVTSGSLDPNKSMQELVSAGLIVDKTASASKQNEVLPVYQNDQSAPVDRVSAIAEGVSVLSQNADRTFVIAPEGSEKQIQPDVLIKKDGTVEMLKQPAIGTDGKSAPLVIQLEGTTSASQAQLQAARELETWIGQRKEVLSKQLQEKAAMEAAAQEQRLREADLAAQRTQNAVDMFNRNGSMSREEADNYFPSAADRSESSQQFEPEQPEQKQSYRYLKESIAALSGANKQAPYETLRRTPENGFAVGRYGMTADIFMSWLSSTEDFAEVLGNPPDFSKLGKLMEQLAKKGKIPKDFAAKFKDQEFCKGFGQFLEKMKAGQGTLNAADIQKFLPKDMQEAVMKGVLDDAFAKKTPAEQVALAMHLGKPLGQLSDADKNDAKNKEFMSATMKVMGLAAAKDQAGKNDRIDWAQSNEPGSPLAFRIARAAERNAENNNTVGWCYREVADTLDNFGVHLYGNSAYMAAPQLARNDKFREVSPSNLKPGTVLVFGQSEGHPHGHITVYLGNGREASDHVQQLVNFKAYGGVRAFEPV